jgi:hypothetical protein
MTPFRSPLSYVALLPVFSGVLLAAPAPAPTRPVSFNRDIRPIMSDTCFHCHGFDAKSRKAGMRLDIREEALKPTKHDLLPIVPGKPDESEIIARIEDKSDPMPPDEAHKVLTPAQKDLFRRWVAEGAVYEPHWAYAALTRPAVPQAPVINGAKVKVENPIDAFIRTRLAEKSIAPSPEAPRARLLRRVSLDLTGLPPTPEEVAAFVADKSPRAYEKQVDRLFASVHHGERLAVWWLDVARFTDTVGFHGDQNQRIFPYRDYVIGAFNRNKRFDQFTIEQLAGDLLPNPTKEQLVATGYNRLNMMTREGGAQAKEYLAKYGAERVRSVAAAWFGSTFGCAECHDHKFDPIKTRDFYELQSFFADMKQWGVYADYNYTPNPELKGYNNDFPFPPEVEVESPYLQARAKRLLADLAGQKSAVAARLKDEKVAAEFEKWVGETRAFLAQEPTGWSQAPLSAMLVKGNEPVVNGEVPIAPGLVVRAPRTLATGESLRVTLHPGPGRVASIRVEVADDVAPPPAMTKGKATARPRAAAGMLRLSAVVRTPGGKEPKKDEKVEFVFADAAAKELRYDGGTDVIGIGSGWKLPAEAGEQRATGTWVLATPRVFTAGEQLVVSVSGAAPAVRIFTSPLAELDPTKVGGAEVRAALQAEPAKRTTAQRELLAEAWLLGTANDRAAFDAQQKLAAHLRETRQGRAWSLITEPVKEPLMVRVLPRGNWQDETGAVVLPATPSFLPGRIESTPEKRLTRLDLAKWIVSEQNPITARTVMNRMWAMFFGTGLSAAVDDLGSQGEPPSHPELLDWLAVEFRESGWDMRRMMKLIVMSETYRQGASLRPELRDTDPSNRLLASQNPRRLEAEFVRDNALFIGGLLNLRDVGGPSVKPYQPDGYYAALQFPDRFYAPSDDDEQWRRGVYVHWQRTFLHPMLANFDAPGRDECAAARVVSNTPQQALTLLNDPTFVEAARAFAARVVAAGRTDDARFSRAFELALAREPKAVELTSLRTHLATQRDYYKANPAEADKLLRTGYTPRPTGDAVELAAWTSVARVILNLQECITRY